LEGFGARLLIKTITVFEKITLKFAVCKAESLKTRKSQRLKPVPKTVRVAHSQLVLE
jgi:hypothetical protein